MELINYYEKIPSLKNKYRNYNKHMPQHPFRLSIVGPSNSGKTNILRNIIDKCQNADKIYLYAKKLDEPLYVDLINHWTAVGKKNGLNLIEYSDDINDVQRVDEINERIQNLIIFDDMITEKNLKRVEELFIRGRKQNASIVFISQSYFSIPKDVRLNCDYFILTKISNKKELTEIAKDHTTDINKELFYEIYRMATRQPYGFLMIDLKTQDPKYKYRDNFSTMVMDGI